MKVIPAELVELEDATCWVRVGGRMVRIDGEGGEWLALQVPPLPEATPETLERVHVAVEAVIPHLERTGVLKRLDLTEPAPSKVAKAPRKVKAPKAVKAATAPAPAKVAAKLRREAGLPSRRKTARTDTALIERARKLVEVQDYSLARAAAAVQLPYSTLYGIAQRDRWFIPKRGATTVPAAPAAIEKAPRVAVSCPNCKRRTETSPCRFCFEKVPELSS